MGHPPGAPPENRRIDTSIGRTLFFIFNLLGVARHGLTVTLTNLRGIGFTDRFRRRPAPVPPEALHAYSRRPQARTNRQGVSERRYR
jgi:hypothetical protein